MRSGLSTDTRVQMANEERASGKDRVEGCRARLLSGDRGASPAVVGVGGAGDVPSPSASVSMWAACHHHHPLPYPHMHSRVEEGPFQGSPDSSVGKESTCNAGDLGSIPGSGRSPGEGIGYPLQYSWASLVAQLV